MTCYDEYYDEYRCCEFCGKTGTSRVPLHRHHVFGGANRKLSERLGMVVDLCHECHEGKRGVHQNRAKDLELKQRFQQEYEDEGHSREEFRALFGKSWL